MKEELIVLLESEEFLQYMYILGLIFLLCFIIIGAVIILGIHFRDGTFKEAVERGDDYYGTPSRIVWCDLILWEVLLLMEIFYRINDAINAFFKKRYK